MRRTWLAAVVAASVLLAGCSSFGGTSAAPASGSAQTSGPGRASAPVAAASPTPQKPGNYVLIMDASGSMRKTDVGTGTRMTAAQAAASTFVGSLPKGSRVGLVTYGDKTLEEAPKSAGCTDVTTAVPLGADMAGVTAAAKALKPVGWTPIGKALQTAAAQAKGRPLNVVLITDGEDTCAPPDPCDTAASLVGSDVGLTISAIGLKTSSDQLTCVATKGKGYFVTASNSNQLARRLEALRDPAAAARTLSPSGVRSITPGQLADDIRKAHPDFPAVSSGTQVRVVWGGCTWVFSAKGVLLSIELGDAGSTIDGLAVGDAASALSVLGTAVSTSTTSGVETRIYPADERLGLGWKVQIKDGRIITVVLCTCLTGTCPPSADQVRKAAGEPESTRIGKVDCVADGTWAITAGTFGPMKNAGWLILQKTGPSWTLASRITSTAGCSRISADAPLAELRAHMPGMCDLAWGPAIIKQAPITMNGIGDLRLGADGSDLEQRGLATATDGQCDANYITVTRLDGSVAGDFRGSRLTGLWVRDTAMKTTAGAHVGMSVSEVQRLYAGKLRSSTHQGDMSPIKTLVYTYGGRILEFSYSDSGTGADTSSVNGIYVSFSDIPFKHGC
ncbi:vWA domain-containing protein [Acidipropionibacterium virtanenii]|uniref:VWFA domain-containing protein n=1 Tax=Acidipropionibacterium virtanenii TaxID=2057246 RepID=A0A344UW99_9ACTN|nr:VWA domain-containing protein [Acidipropionibacterium virtanenii]AXE39547.1 hypothetical protein JS278_02408 [Acidipropionibacterium virtanenii]